MKNFIAIAVELGIGILAIRVFGIPAWLIAAITLPILLFWHRVLGAVVGSTIATVRLVRPNGVDEDAWIVRSLRWLVSVEGVRHERGGWMHPENVTFALTGPGPSPDAPEPDAPEAPQSKSAERFAQMAEPAVFLIRERDGMTRSQSRIGGWPALPAGMDWPEHGGAPLHFLAEIHLDEVPVPPAPDALPRGGVLFFFVDLSDVGDMAGTVRYADTPGAVPVAPPNETPEIWHGKPMADDAKSLKEIHLRPLTLPLLDPGSTATLERDAARALERYAFKRHREAILSEVEGGDPLLHPPRENYMYSMIGGPKLDVANATEGEGVKLLQFDSDEGLGFQFGDMGVLEFWIDEEDARAGLWDRAYTAVSSC